VVRRKNPLDLEAGKEKKKGAGERGGGKKDTLISSSRGEGRKKGGWVVYIVNLGTIRGGKEKKKRPREKKRKENVDISLPSEKEEQGKLIIHKIKKKEK